MLLNSFESLLANDSINPPSTGKVLYSDTTEVSVPASLVKRANAKMIERKYLIAITKEQDSIIDLKNKHINEQQVIIDDYKRRIYDVNSVNESIKHKLDKQRRVNRLVVYGCCCVVTGLIIGVISK